MPDAFIIQRNPTRIPVPGNKLIEEFIGRASTGHEKVSVAHMIAPPGWGEPAQTPEFDEITIMIRGKMQVILDGEEQILHAGEVLQCSRGITVQYSNPYDEENEYWAICLPAFSVDSARREE
ncbi:MAG: cupin domain-containing protein [Bacteroidetes bacterium]|nr:cupin domain-containing protein [Bacteroidota bacterium]MCH8524891.1 cupin domain-containing protein [Balneolales bacterium]